MCPVLKSSNDPWDEVELIRPAQLLLSGLAPPPTLAERAFMELARQWHRDFRQLGESTLERSTDIRALSCLLLALDHGQEFSRVSTQQVRANRALAESLRPAPWVDTLTWKLCIVSMERWEFGESAWAGELTANLSHHYSPIRRWMTEIAWIARVRLRAEHVVPQLLTNLADKLAYPYASAGLAATFFVSEDDFWHAAKAFVPPDNYGDQYRNRLESATELGMLELQAPFWKLEAECLRAIGDAVFDKRLSCADSEESKRTPQVPGNAPERKGLASEEREANREMAPALAVLNDLAYVLECAALDYMGEGKSALGSLCESLESDPAYAVHDHANLAVELRECLGHYLSGNREHGAKLLSRASRGLWKQYINGE